MADDGGTYALYLVEGIVVQPSPSRLGYFGGNSRPGSPGSNNGDTRRRSPLWGHHFWSRRWIEVALRWSSVALPA
jgi:hypothetical protein